MSSKCRCCLIQLYGQLQPANAEPLSIEVLAGALDGIADVRLCIIGSFQQLDEQDELLTAITDAHYDVVGISCPQGTLELAMRVIGRVVDVSPNTYVVLGHALPTSSPELFLGRFPTALIVRGWGEIAFVDICRQIHDGEVQPERIPSLTYIDRQGRRCDNPIQWPAEAGVPKRMSADRYFARVEASRGCHYNVCTFCSRPPADPTQPPWVRLETKRVLAQITELAAQGVTTFTFADEDFIGNDPAGALELAEHLSTMKGLDFALSVRADNIITHQSPVESRLREHALEKLRDAGLTLVFVGIESFSPSQLRRFGKGTTPEDNIAAIRALERLGVELELGLILFDPLTTLDELRTNIQTLDETGYWKYAGQLFSSLRPQAGTPYVTLLLQRRLLHGFQPDTAEYDVSYGDSQVDRIHNLCLAWNRRFDRFYRALRNATRSELGAGHYGNTTQQYRSLQMRFLADLFELPSSELSACDIETDPAYSSTVALAKQVYDSLARDRRSHANVILARATRELLAREESRIDK